MIWMQLINFIQTWRIEMYVYIRSERGLWTVGFYDPSGKWHPDSDWDNRAEARARVHYLNGGTNESSE